MADFLGLKSLGQQHPHLFAPFELLHLLVAQLFRDAEAVEQHGRFRLGFVAVHFGELGFELAGADAVRLGKISFGIERLALGHDLVELGVPHHDGVEDRLFVKGEVVLAQHGEAFAGSDGNLSLVGVELPGQKL